MSWYLEVLKKYAVFEGRARRKEYWYFTLFNAIFMALSLLISLVLFDFTFILVWIYILATMIPGLAVSVRRLHDTGRSGWLYLLFLIPLVGTILWLVFMAEDGTPGENQYGPNPKAESRLSEPEQTAEAAHQAVANAPQPAPLAQPMPPLAHQAAANASQPAPFGCLLEGQDSTGRPFALTISALALGDRAGVTLGRSPANAEFIIDHEGVSREHVRLTCADGELYAEDLNALNGTKVNGRLLNPHEQVLLRDNDRLEVGSVAFTVRLV